MKKILAMLLSFSILLSAVCINAAAAESTEDDQKKRTAYDNLYVLYEYIYTRDNITGICRVTFSKLTDQRLDEAMDVIKDKNSTLEDYTSAYDNLISAVYNEYIDKYTARTTYENALAEQNYNNWYSQKDWSRFVSAREALGNALESNSNDEITNAFYDLLEIYNIMTNRYKVMGDVNKDGEVNVIDATLIQKYLSGEVNFTGAQKMLIATNYNYENPNIISATRVQKYAADYTAYFDDNFVPQYSYYRDSYERRMQRTFNFTICPKSSDGMYTLDNGYFDTEFLQEYYIRFYKEI